MTEEGHKAYPGTKKYTLEQVKRLFDYAREKDVDTDYLKRDCTFDARSAAINFWTENWGSEKGRKDSELIGCIYIDWTDTHIWLVDVCRPFSVEKIFQELARLEKGALGEVVNGRE